MSDIQIPEVSSGDLPEGINPDSGTMVTPDQVPAPAPAAAAPEAAPAPAAEAQPALSPEASQYAAERDAFVQGAAGMGTQLPENFESFEDYFDSLKSAQGEFTRARQEIAELKAQLAGEQPAADAAEEASEEAVNPMADNDELLIPEPEAEEAGTDDASDDEYEVVEVGVDDDTWNAWGAELDSTGEMSQETREQVYKSFPGVTDEMIDMYVQGRAAMLQSNFNSAADVVGGSDSLNSILSWAANELPSEERAAMNAALQTPARDATLLGLKARYESSTTVAARNAEPSATPNRVNAAMSEEPITGFTSTHEMIAAQRDARYGTDPAYTALIQQRMAKSTWLYGG